MQCPPLYLNLLCVAESTDKVLAKGNEADVSERHTHISNPPFGSMCDGYSEVITLPKNVNCEDEQSRTISAVCQLLFHVQICMFIQI